MIRDIELGLESESKMNDEFIHTGVKATQEDLKKLTDFARKGWMNGDTMIVFSIGEGIKRDEATRDAQKVCHELALRYGLPEIPGYYGILKDGEFIEY